MKRILLSFTVLLLALLMMAPVLADDDVTIVEGEDSCAFLYAEQGQTLLLGYCDHQAFLSQCPGTQVTAVVICCDHPEHVADARQLAEQLGAATLDRTGDSMLIRWEDGAVIAGEYAFSPSGKVPGMMTFDCRGRYLQFRSETSQKAVNVRKEPSTGAGRVAKIQMGTALTVIGETTNERGEVWYMVRLGDGDMGYIRSDLLSISTDMEVVPYETPVQEGENAQPTAPVIVVSAGGSTTGATASDARPPEGINGFAAFFARTNDSGVNVRVGPSVKADRVAQLKEGVAVTVLDAVKSEEGQTWYCVELQDGRRGYIRADLLVQADSLTDVAAPARTGSRRYIGNKRTMVFHRPSCHTLPKSRNQVYFSSRSYALAKGYRPCHNCDP